MGVAGCSQMYHDVMTLCGALCGPYVMVKILDSMGCNRI